MAHIGFTGTKKGMTRPQQHAVRDIIERYGDGYYLSPDTFHHGMCAGADEQASRIAHDLRCFVIGHPGHGKPDAAGVCHPNYHGYADQNLPPKPYLARNHDIIAECGLLVAAPYSAEVRRSGTWATVRYARTAGRRIVYAWRNGQITEE